MSKLLIYTDGSSRGNPGKGGWGVVMKFNDKTKELSGNEKFTTNNRMELMAVIEASKYVIDSIEKGWVFIWAKKTDFGGKKNEDLWRRFLKSYHKFDIKFNWVKGHNGHPENERCDVLATMAADRN